MLIAEQAAFERKRRKLGQLTEAKMMRPLKTANGYGRSPNGTGEYV